MKKYLRFYKQSIKISLAYKMEFIFQMFSTVLEAAIMIFLWKKIYESTGNGLIGNFSLNEMIVYIVLTFTVGKALSSSVDSEVPYEVREGTIAMELIKPYSYILRHLFSDLGRVSMGSIGAIGILLVSLFFFDANLTLGNTVIFIISMILAYIITFAINMIVSLVSFYTTYIWGVIMFKSVVIAFLSGQLIPITFFPDSFARVLKILPFSYTNFYPIYMFMGKLSSKEVVVALFIQLVWAVVLLISMKKLYTKALLRLQVAGG